MSTTFQQFLLCVIQSMLFYTDILSRREGKYAKKPLKQRLFACVSGKERWAGGHAGHRVFLPAVQKKQGNTAPLLTFFNDKTDALANAGVTGEIFFEVPAAAAANAAAGKRSI